LRVGLLPLIFLPPSILIANRFVESFHIGMFSFAVNPEIESPRGSIFHGNTARHFGGGGGGRLLQSGQRSRAV
jgi:hypothetical protein